jgi:hypothetical protein
MSRSQCAYCSAPATSVDHVPPKGIFGGERYNLRTVPACATHNNAQSRLDERFRDFLALTVGVATPETVELWDRTMRSLRRPQAAARKAELRSKMRRIAPQLWAIPIEYDAVRAVTERTARGLYFHHYGERLSPVADIQSGLIRDFPDLAEFVSDMARESVADGQFQYAYSRMDLYPSISCWVFVFHRRVITMAITDRALSDMLTERAEGTSS